jgi:hypothetical protein
MWLYLQYTLQPILCVPECEGVVVLHNTLTEQHTCDANSEHARGELHI